MADNKTRGDPTTDNVKLLTAPEPGQTQTISVMPGEVLLMEFDINEQTIVPDGNDLRIEFANGAVIVLEDFATLADQGAAPFFSMADGSIVPGDILLAALTVEPVETAAGEAATGSGGAGEYREDFGDTLDGVDKLGTQDPDPFGGILAAVPEDEEPPLEVPVVPAEEEQPEEPENLPPVANDDALFVNAGMGGFAISSRSQGDFFQVDLSADGGYTKLFETDIGLQDITIAPDGTVWGVAHGKEGGTWLQQIVIINPETETVTYEGVIDGLDTNSAIDGLTFGDDGTLYVVQGDTVYALSGIDTDTPLATELVDLGNYQGTEDLVSVGAMLYTLSQNGHLLAIDPDAQIVTDLGDTGLSPGEYGIAEGAEGTLYMVSAQEVLVLQPEADGFTVLDDFDFDYPAGFGVPWGLAGGFPITSTLTGSLNVLDNDTDLDGDSLTVIDVDGYAVDNAGTTIEGDYGTLTIHEDGSYSYEVTSLDQGEEVFTYTISDGQGGTDTGNLVIYVNATLGTIDNDELSADSGGDILYGGAGDDILTAGDGDDLFLYRADGDEGDDIISNFDIDHDTVRLIDVLDGSDGIPGIEDVNISVDVVGPDVTLTINDTTNITLEGINTGGTFTGMDSLDELMLAGLKVDFNLDTYGS